MKEKPLKASDIAGMVGIPESEMRRIAEAYDSAIPSRTLGRVKLYEPKAAGIVERIISLESAGKSGDEIAGEFSGKPAKKSTKERITAKVAKNAGAVADRRGRSGPVESRPPPAPPRRESEDRAAFLELKIDRLTARVERLETELKAEREKRDQDREAFSAIVSGLSEKLDITDEWVEYFDDKVERLGTRMDDDEKVTREWIDYTEAEIERLKRPFWRRKRN